jgi:hypothetical protein
VPFVEEAPKHAKKSGDEDTGCLGRKRTGFPCKLLAEMQPQNRHTDDWHPDCHERPNEPSLKWFGLCQSRSLN